MMSTVLTKGCELWVTVTIANFVLQYFPSYKNYEHGVLLPILLSPVWGSSLFPGVE